MSEEINKRQASEVVRASIDTCLYDSGILNKSAMRKAIAVLMLMCYDENEQVATNHAMSKTALEAAKGMTHSSMNMNELLEFSKILLGVMDWVLSPPPPGIDTHTAVLDFIFSHLAERRAGMCEVPQCFDDESLTIIARAGSATAGLSMLRAELNEAVNNARGDNG